MSVLAGIASSSTTLLLQIKLTHRCCQIYRPSHFNQSPSLVKYYAINEAGLISGYTQEIIFNSFFYFSINLFLLLFFSPFKGRLTTFNEGHWMVKFAGASLIFHITCFPLCQLTSCFWSCCLWRWDYLWINTCDRFLFTFRFQQV